MKRLFNLRCYSTLKSSHYITTPIYYVNAPPHIGHLYSSVIADALNRWHYLLNPGINTYFATGTDEHGLKIQQAALKHNESLPDYCSNISSKFRDLSDGFNIGYTDFIRTTEARHIDAVQKLWKKLYNNGHIYSARYAGWYCTPDENFLADSELKESILPNGEKILVSAESGHVVEWTEEDNYMFKLSNFQEDLEKWLISTEDAVKPKKFHKILLEAITRETLPDVSVSRPCNRVHWGVKVPNDETQTVYVWLDALVNYLTVAGYPNINNELFQKVWPPDVQVIGKDILKFHGIYWPAFLMAADLELPKTILCHSHWTVNGVKMSKSKNNVICPIQASEKYTGDGMRYFLLREGVAHSDGNYSDEKVMRILNSELADTFGNLLNRCCGQILNPQQIYPAVDNEIFNSVVSRMDIATKLVESIHALPDICHKHYSEYNLYKMVDSVILMLHTANLFFETMKPWELRKNSNLQKELEVSLHIAMEALRISAIILSPIIPNLSEKVLNKLNIPNEERFWSNAKEHLWNNKNFKGIALATEKLVLFQRTLSPKTEYKQKKKNKQ